MQVFTIIQIFPIVHMENKDLRLTFDGPGHCIIQLRKEGWATKIEPASFGSYDNPNVVGS
jgi:hypothetical protein